MIRIAGATTSVGIVGLEESLDALRALGFEWVDVGAASSGNRSIDPIEAAGDPEGYAARIRAAAEKCGVRLCSLLISHFGKPVNHPDKDVRDWSRNLFDGASTFAQKAGFESIMMIPGHVHAELGQTPDDAFAASAGELRHLVDVAESKELRCNVKLTSGCVAKIPADGLKLVDQVPGLGLTLDYAHPLQLGFHADEVEPLHRHTRHVHVKQAAEGELQLEPDDGEIDIGRLVRKLKDDDFAGAVSVEYNASQSMIDAGWDFPRATARMKQIIEAALAGD